MSDRGCSQSIKTRNVDFECFSIPRGIDSCDDKKQRLLGDSVPKCALKRSEKHLKPQRLRHIRNLNLRDLETKDSIYMGISIGFSPLMCNSLKQRPHSGDVYSRGLMCDKPYTCMRILGFTGLRI